MIQFPVFERLGVEGFGLYPGKKNHPGLTAEFQPGLTLVLGANGLGKTTLITILFRLLTGPYDIPALSKRADLGNAKLNVTALSTARKAIFAQRVSDGAADATARLTLKIGDTSIVVARRLRDLALTQQILDDEELEADDQSVFQLR